MSTDAGFLNDLDLDNVEADPNYIGDGQWPAFIFDSKVITKKDQTKSWIITYKVAPDSKQYAGVTQDEWFALTVEKDGSLIAQPDQTKKSWLKKRVLSVGVPESRVKEVTPAEIIGTPVFITIRHKGNFQNVVDVVLRDESTGEAKPTAVPEQSAATPAPSGNVTDLL
jgi:hypothetical protein